MMKLLHLEDNDSDAELVAAVLSREWPQCQITRLASEHALRESLEQQDFDVILSDYSMPGFDGLSALEIVRELTPDTPFVFLSGTIGEERAIEALRNGATDYVLKDSPGRLLSAMRSAVKHAERDAAKRRAEEGLRKSREQFQQIAESIEDFIVLLDLHGHCLYSNPAFRKLLGLHPDTADVNMYQIVHPEDANELRGAIRLASISAVQRDVEFRVRTPDGQTRHLEARMSLPRHSDQASTVLLAGRDVTERKEAEDKLHEQASLLGKARDAICLINLQFTVTHWNASAERIYGRSAATALGKDLRKLLFGSQTQRFDTAFALTLAHGEWRGEFRLTRPDGGHLVVDSSWSLVNDAQGRPKSILCIDSDVTSRKQLETELQRAQRIEGLGMLAGGIAHDLNNILSPILMSVGLLRSSRVREDEQMILDTLEASATHGTELVQQILLFARGGEGQRTPLHLGEMLEELEGFLKTSLRRIIELSLSHDPHLWPVQADATQLKQVLMNLCVNARDAMPKGGRIRINATNISVSPGGQRGFHGEIPAGSYVRLSVADTGTGIPPEVLERIFDPFFTTKELGKGTGLGLSTIAGIVQNHGGSIQVESFPGRGTTFHIYLPATFNAIERPMRPVPPASLPQGTGELILIIDDDEGIRLVAEKILSSQGYAVRTACDGEKGLSEFHEHRQTLQLVLCDQMMPGLRGAEVLAKIHAEAPDVKLIAMSGLMEDSKDSPKFYHNLPKPLNSETLLRTVRLVLDGMAVK